MRIALLADIHGNWPALAAVVAELERLQPDEGWWWMANHQRRALFRRRWSTLCARSRGRSGARRNHEFYYLDFGTERAIPGCEDPDRWGQMHWLVDNLSPSQGSYLAALPDERTLYFQGAAALRVALACWRRNRTRRPRPVPRAPRFLPQPSERLPNLPPRSRACRSILYTVIPHIRMCRSTAMRLAG